MAADAEARLSRRHTRRPIGAQRAPRTASVQIRRDDARRKSGGDAPGRIGDWGDGVFETDNGLGPVAGVRMAIINGFAEAVGFAPINVGCVSLDVVQQPPASIDGPQSWSALTQHAILSATRISVGRQFAMADVARVNARNAVATSLRGI